MRFVARVTAFVISICFFAKPTFAQDMIMADVGGAKIMTMAQLFPIVTEKKFYVTQPAIMSNVFSADYRTVLRATLNFEAWTQKNGEISYGAWGEGFIDKRHPHTLLHEMVLSRNWGSAHKGASISVGKGFAPYGTDDPMSRPVVKYPTNHHLSQILERWMLQGVYAYQDWGVEAGIFDGNEPEGPYDLDNFQHFGNSWSARVTRRFGAPMMRTWPWEISASYARVKEHHDDGDRAISLQNIAARHEQTHGNVRLYALVEASRSEQEAHAPLFSVLGEASATQARHSGYARMEYARRPEYARTSKYRYDHDAEAIGATRWLIGTVGYGYAISERTISPRPFIELQYNRVRPDINGINPDALFGKRNFWSISVGTRIFIGGESMRMGTYGVLDPMTAMHSDPAHGPEQHHHH